jgi:branched-chain amino acid transport system substrate-binding protein
MTSLPWMRACRALTALVAILAAGALTRAQAQGAQPPVKLGLAVFLTGAAAQPFGIPSKNAAELLIDAINAGSLPAPYSKPGLGGAKIEVKYLDESGPTANVVTEYRNLVQRDGMNVVIGYISSGNCTAVAPVAEELKTLTVFHDCGTPRLFEERDYKYVFRPSPTATMDNVAAARYVARKFPHVAAYAGANPNYAWGQDSWADFVRAMKIIEPKATAAKELFPKLFAGEYGAEISTLLTASAPIVHTSFWDGDFEAFVSQAVARGLPKKMTIVATAGEAQMFRLGNRLPDGTILGARGPHGVMAPDTELNRWFQKSYTARYGTPPTYPSYHMAQGVLALKAAWDKAAAAKNGARPTIDDVIAAFTGLEFDGPSAHLRMTLGKGHQAVSDIAYGTYKFNAASNKPEIVDVVRFPAECVNPPPNMKADEWLAAGMPGAKCP